jgi:ATP phosphoribosyltransferase regulatory subunit
VRLPAGVRDWLPHELARKRDVELIIRAVFGRWAYEEVQTPTFERFDVLEKGLGSELVDQAYRFSDRRATALALRPEMTTPIARLVSTRMREAPLPLRLSYVTPVYRYYDQPQEGRLRELTQGGVELIGSPGLDADAETLFMAIETLDEIGLRDALFDVNDASVVDGILEGVGLTPETALIAKGYMKERNIVALRALEPKLVDFAMTRGGTEVLGFARRVCRTPASIAALDRLAELLRRAQMLGYGARIQVDFALLRDLEYYTGFIFEGYVPEVGFSLCGGGRYDGLLPRFGFNVPAVGWTAGVERLLIALERRGKHASRRRQRIDVLVSGSDVVAARERAAGNVVRFAGGESDEAALVADARAHHIPRIVIAVNGRVREVRVTPPLDERLPAQTVAAKWESK